MSEIILTEEQSLVRDEVLQYLLEPYNPKIPFQTLGGLAGTGKTTLIRQLVEDLNDEDTIPVIVSFTGKAVDVLRRKGLNASTIHSTIYKPIFEKGIVTGYSKLDASEICSSKKWIFICDESSMVADEPYQDLLALHRPILFVGDYGQLEPVGNDPRIMAHLDFELKQIHRQAAENPIIKFAYEVREAVYPPSNRRSDTDKRLTVLPANMIKDDDYLWADQIICTYNKTRHQVNAAVRKLQGRKEAIEAGDKMICLKNNREFQMFNGQQFTVLENRNYEELEIEVPVKDGKARQIIPISTQYLGKDPPAGVRFFNNVIYIDHAYALTCHKTQGSEYDRVLVIEQYATFLNMQRWRYTAATRAACELRYFTPVRK